MSNGLVSETDADAGRTRSCGRINSSPASMGRVNGILEVHVGNEVFSGRFCW
jgi:hypothetical protein